MLAKIAAVETVEKHFKAELLHNKRQTINVNYPQNENKIGNAYIGNLSNTILNIGVHEHNI